MLSRVVQPATCHHCPLSGAKHRYSRVGVRLDRSWQDRAISKNTFFSWPTGVSYGTALRAFDLKTKEWAIWWIDSRYPHLPLDPPVKGRFENGVGTFYSDSLVDGKAVRTRFIWSQITPASAHWEQASSEDAGETWDTNWTMEFRRVR